MSRALETLGVFLANLLWCLSCIPGWVAFAVASRNVRRTQTRVLAGLLKRHAATELGKARGFASIRTLDDFRSTPLTDYEDYLPWIEKVKAGKPAVLTRDAVTVLQPTSGSSAATKLVPYTRSLQREFSAAIDPWILSLYLAYPALLFGRHYWSISPSTPCAPDSSSQVRVGFADDTEYLRRTPRFLTRALFAVPAELARVADPKAFEYLTLLFLLAARNLRVISVWHPSFLTLLMKAAPTHIQAIIQDIEAGTIESRVQLSADLRRSLESRLVPNPGRAGELRGVDFSLPDFPARIWPFLRVISCWTDGRSEPWLSEIVRGFPHAAIQAKGLAATEGIVSFPVGRTGRKVCAIRSHFFEFLDADTGELQRAWEIVQGREYAVILTTSGGLVRYRLHDRVRVTGFHHNTPCLEFIARDNLVSDVVGEKLNGRHVEDGIRHVEKSCGVRFRFAMLAPVAAGPAVGYVFFFQVEEGSTGVHARIGDLLEKELRRNFHYDHARQLSQLQPLRLFRVQGDADGMYRRHLQQKGVKAGEVKFCSLSSDVGWPAALAGEYVTALRI